MHWPGWKVWIALTAALVAVIASLSSSARAQPPYPPVPPSVVTGAVSEPTPAVGATTTVTCTVLDEDGNPIQGATCAFTIISQPGTDATISPATAVTNAQGKAYAVLSAGSTPGEIAVEVKADGVMSQVKASVQAPVTPVPGIAPPTVPGVPGMAPPTGGGPGGGADNWEGWLIAIASALAAAAATLLAWHVLRGRPRAD